MVIIGILLLALGGVAAGSFYIPFKKVRNWAWESYWLVNGLFSWILMPWIVALITVPTLMLVLKQSPAKALFWTYLFGLLWGIGGLTFGLSMRYLGMSLGYAIALGFCAAFGTIIPPIYDGTFLDLLTSASGLATLSGVLVCLIGIGICGWAGISKERELSDEKKKETIKEFSFIKGLIVAFFAGIMSACMAFGFVAGSAIAKTAVENGTSSLWANNPVLIVIFAGGFTTNFLWCIFLNIKNKSTKNYFQSGNASLFANYVFSALAGIIWYFQFMLYGMGRTKMSGYDFASWSVLMAMVIVVSNIWGLIFREWKGCSKRTISIITSGIVVVIMSIVLIGIGNYLVTIGK
ncbi:MAG: L-rhamnose/proton symporter RhaT [Planctomycetota bacterium]|nr:MAG: L-rhamnose/proton symporter RhaT [Planctomycetota bacterium]